MSRPEQDLPSKRLPTQGQYIVGVRFRTTDDDTAGVVGAPASRIPNEPGRPMPVITDIDVDDEVA